MIDRSEKPDISIFTADREKTELGISYEELSRRLSREETPPKQKLLPIATSILLTSLMTWSGLTLDDLIGSDGEEEIEDTPTQ